MIVQTRIIAGNICFGIVCFVLSAIGAIDTINAVSCGVALMAGWSALMLLLAEPIDGADL